MRGKKIPLEGWRKDVPFVNFHRGQKPFNILFRRMNEKKKKKKLERISRKDGINGVFRGAAVIIWLGRGRREAPSCVRLECYLCGGQKGTCIAA